MTELLPCPFCGGEAEIHPSDDWDVNLTGATYFIWCDKCETRGDYYNTEAEAIAAWNTRAERMCHPKPTAWGGSGYHVSMCSECGGAFHGSPAAGVGFPNFCPNCGAKVVEQ